MKKLEAQRSKKASMSLFQSREWWRIQNGIDEEFDTGCLAIGTFQQDSTIGKLESQYSSTTTI